MISNVFRESFLSNIKKYLNDAQIVGQLDHSGLKGTLREIFVKKIIEPVMPPDIITGSGKLVSYSGMTSAQVDVVLYAPSIMPPAIFDVSSGLFPVEAALYTIEVKSKLASSNLKEAITNARSISALQTLKTEHWYVGDESTLLKNIITDTAYPVNVLFAFDTDLGKGVENELSRYRRYDENADRAPAIQVICVVGSGYWYWKSGEGWYHLAASEQLDEVMLLLAGITNTVPQLLAAKGRPRFGHYLCPDQKLFEKA